MLCFAEESHIRRSLVALGAEKQSELGRRELYNLVDLPEELQVIPPYYRN